MKQTYNSGVLQTSVPLPGRVEEHGQPLMPANAEIASSLEASKIIVEPLEGKEVFASQNNT